MTETKIHNQQDFDPIRERCQPVLYNPEVMPWDSVREKIVAIERDNFGVESDQEPLMRANFHNPANTVAVTTDSVTGEVVGFTIMVPTAEMYTDQFFPERREREDIDLATTAYVNTTAFAPAYQGHKLVFPLLAMVEGKLWERGFRFLERDAADTGYAANLIKNNKERILSQEPHPSKYGPQVFLRMRLEDPTERQHDKKS